jgi:LytR cell envelope-related transcriptional attenuator
VAALTFGVIELASGGSGSAATTKRAASTSSNPSGARQGARFANGRVTVAVLNGTPIAGLAKRVADQLKAEGFRPGAVTNAAEQTRSGTLVSFLPGQRRAGRVVARSLRARAMAPIDSSTRAVACPGTQRCPDVVVTVGADRAG